MGPWLLDVNVLIAVLWPSHSAHQRARTWFESHRDEGWVTCPFTETGFLRVVTNPSFTPEAPLVEDALAILSASKQSGQGHSFWPADIPGERAVERFGGRVMGHKQIPDAYLLALAIHHRGRLATFDQRMLRLAPEGEPERASLEILL